MYTPIPQAGAEIPAILTKREAAKYIRCTPRYLERQIRAGRLKALKPTGKLVRIRRLEVANESAKNKRRVAARAN